MGERAKRRKGDGMPRRGTRPLDTPTRYYGASSDFGLVWVSGKRCRCESGPLASILPVNILWGFSSPDLPDKKFSFVLGLVVSRRQQGLAEDRLGGATRAQDPARVAALPLRSLEYPPRDFSGHLFRLRAVDRF
jgi:hypothetical protein